MIIFSLSMLAVKVPGRSGSDNGISGFFSLANPLQNGRGRRLDMHFMQ
jgi:hypothetical protein